MAVPSQELAIPFRIDGSGRIAVTSDLAEVVRSHVLAAIGTQRGERAMRGDYGTDTITHLFDGLSTATEIEIRDTITTAMASWVPEATLTNISLAEDQLNGKLSINVSFSIANTVQDNLQISLPMAVS